MTVSKCPNCADGYFPTNVSGTKCNVCGSEIGIVYIRNGKAKDPDCEVVSANRG